jgi:hypothetical protein
MLTERLANLNFVTNVMCDSREDPDENRRLRKSGYMGIQLQTGQEIAGFHALEIRSLLRAIADR